MKEFNQLNNDWHYKSISQRLEWYSNEIDSLFDYLAFKEPFTGKHLGHAALALQHIKYHLRMDLKTIPINNARRINVDYVDAVGKTFLKLEELQSDLRNWLEVLDRANEIIILFKHDH